METEKKIFDWSVEAFVILCILALWIFVILKYNKLPAIIPCHYNAAGEIDGYGSKSAIFLLPVITTLLYFFLTFVQRRPQFFNFANIQVNDDNAEPLFKIGTRLVLLTKAFVTSSFSMMAVQMIQDAMYAPSIPDWIVRIPLILTFVVVVYTVIKIQKYKN
jgi:uncharacterized membrane protein